MDVIFTPLAERQIESLHQYISRHSHEERPDGYITRIITYCQGFAIFPQRGSRDDVLPGLRVRGFERPVTIAYTATTEALLIEGMFYGGQDFEAVLGDVG